MGSNAWDRAQRAITGAEERDSGVVTPDNAVSPFDASATMIIPTPDLPGTGRGGRHQRPDDPEAAETSAETGASDASAIADTADTADTSSDGAGRPAPRLGERRRPAPRPGRVPLRRLPAVGATDTDADALDEPPTVELASEDDAPTVDVATSPDAPPGPGSSPRTPEPRQNPRRQNPGRPTPEGRDPGPRPTRPAVRGGSGCSEADRLFGG